ncbi:MAG: 1-deoxy-D-xylulose-5-phosphate reductoisomerase [Clostridia bacterium]|nr:1-deoxy-D-xylulose-5-phosphate reductoisomerase [Clostridia bacterium]
MKKLAILGSTGSIGTQTLDVVRNNPDLFSVSVLSCASKLDVIRRQIDEFHPEMVVLANEKDALEMEKDYPGICFEFGNIGLEAAASSDCDMVVNALMGIKGLAPTYHAILAGHEIAFANKETLVAGGALIMGMAHKCGVSLLPVDSEHSAIFQCLQGNPVQRVKRIIITASGGPFRGYSLEQLENVTLEQAMKHPKWNMGPKITIDSATLMNKGLEVIEASWLFDMPLEKISVVVHPQSIIHSMVEYEDNSIIAQMGFPDMRVPIGYALSYPDRLPNDLPSLKRFEKAPELSFELPDMETFKCMKLALDAMKAGGSYTAALNGANEALVQYFLKGRIRFIDIQNMLDEVMQHHKPIYKLDLPDILRVDRDARVAVKMLVERS